jgi:hypothetical protein
MTASPENLPVPTPGSDINDIELTSIDMGNAETLVVPTALPTIPNSETDQIALQHEPDLPQLPQAALDAILRRVNRRDSLTADQLQLITGLPKEQAEAIFVGLQHRGRVSGEADRHGHNAVWHPPLKPEEKRPPLRERTRRMLGRSAALGALQIGESRSYVGYYARKLTGKQPHSTESEVPVINNNIHPGIVIVDNPVQRLMTHGSTIQSNSRQESDRQTESRQTAHSQNNESDSEPQVPIDPSYEKYFDPSNLRRIDDKIANQIREEVQVERQTRGITMLPTDEFKRLSGQVRRTTIERYTSDHPDIPPEVMRLLEERLRTLDGKS